MRTLRDRVINTIAEQLGGENSAVAACADLRTEFGLDSLDDIEIVMALEDEFDVVIGDDEAAKWKSTEDVIAAIESALA